MNIRSRYIRTSLAFTLLAVGLSALFQNCSPGFMPDTGFIDAASLSSAVGSAKTRRLSNTEYRRSIQKVVEYQFARRPNPPPLYSYYLYSPNIQGALSSLPGDTLATKLGTDQLATNLSTARMDAYINTAYAISKTIAVDNNLRTKFAGACATSESDISDSTCVDPFLKEFATLSFRTPPTAGEIAELKKNAGNWRTLIARVLVHPRFLLHFERDGAKDSRTGSYRLTDYELEAKLASIFWKSVPDVAGLQVAASGALRTPQGLQAEIKRLLAAPEAKEILWLFYQQWLGASRLPINGYSSGSGYDAFAAPLQSSQLNNSFRDAVLTDARQYIEHLTWTEPAKLETLFRSPLIFTTDPVLASIYGVSPRANASAAPVTDSSGRYQGLLTRPVITQQKPSNNGDINHIQRGVLLLTNLLGRELGLPANFADQQQASLDIPITASTRFETNAKTSIGSCIGCHSTINPAGFAFSHFDTLGRYINTEVRYRPGSGTTPVASNPVDSTTTLVLNSKAYQISDTRTLTDAIFESGAIYQGFASYYFQFAFGRPATSGPDRAVVNDLKTNLKNKTVLEALEALAQTKEFSLSQTSDL